MAENYLFFIRFQLKKENNQTDTKPHLAFVAAEKVEKKETYHTFLRPEKKSVVAETVKFVTWPVNYHSTQCLCREILATMATIFFSSWLHYDKYLIKSFILTSPI